MKSEWLDQLEKMQTPLTFFVAMRFKTKDGCIACSKWLTWAEWKQQKKTLPNYRQVLHNEIVLETDYPAKETNFEVAQEIMKHLRQQGYGYRCWFSGNKSFHVHLIMSNDLTDLIPEQAVRCKKLWVTTTLPKAIADDIDDSNLGKKHLIGIEGTLHPKTSQPKTLVEEWSNWLNNEMPKEIIEQASKEPLLESCMMQQTNNTPKRCAFLEYCLVNRIDLNNVKQNKSFSPNAYAYFNGDQNLLQQLVGMQQQENITLARLNCWTQYKPEFNCKQLQKFAGSVGKRSICDLCLLERRENE